MFCILQFANKGMEVFSILLAPDNVRSVKRKKDC